MIFNIQKGQLVTAYNGLMIPAGPAKCSSTSTARHGTCAAGVTLVELGDPLAPDNHRYMMEPLETKVCM